MADKKTPKLYTLEDAYSEILRIKNEMGLKEYQERAEQMAFQRGYKKACDDLEQKIVKEIGMYRSIFGGL